MHFKLRQHQSKFITQLSQLSKKEVDYHDVCKRQAQNILDLMQGHRKIDSNDLGLDEYPYRESFISALSTEDDTISLEFTENNEGDVINFPKRY